MRPSFEEMTCRAVEYAQFMVENDKTVREAARNFGCSKSSIFRTIKTYLKYSGRSDLVEEYERLAKDHFNSKYLKGGKSTKLKYERLRNLSK